MEDIVQRFVNVADNSYGFLADWKDAHKGKVIGIMPMRFPE